MPTERAGKACPAWSSFTRTAASTRTSRTSPGAWRWRASLRSASISCRALGGTPATDEEAAKMFQSIDRARSGRRCGRRRSLSRRPRGDQRQGRRHRLLLRRRHRQPDGGEQPRPRAGVAYYGQQPQAEDVPKIKAKLMLHYAGLDERINAGIPAYEAALKAAGVGYQIFVYDGAQPRLQQRHLDGALRQGGRRPCLVAHGRHSSRGDSRRDRTREAAGIPAMTFQPRLMHLPCHNPA